MPLVIAAATSGQTTIQATDAVTATITLPSATGTVQLSGAAASFTDLTTTGNTILGNASTDTLNVGNGDLIKDASGNVGIGTASPSTKLHVYTGSATSTYTRVENTAGILYLGTKSGGEGYVATESNTALTFATNGTEKARIDSSGNLLVGTTSATSGYLVNIGNGASAAAIYLKSNGGGAVITGVDSATAPSSGYSVGHLNTTNAYQVSVGGSGGVQLASGGTSWSSMSDYRLKNVTGVYANALADIGQLKPVKFTWKADVGNKPQVGVLAQSVELVVPEAIDHLRIDKEDKTDYLGVRYTELIPLLIASIQELNAKFEEYKASHP